MERIASLLPDFISSVRTSLESRNHAELASQLGDLALSHWTHDPEADAGYFYLTGQAPLNEVEKNVIGVRHGVCIELDDLEGIVVVDTDNFNRITGIEILWREDVVNKLREAMAPRE